MDSLRATMMLLGIYLHVVVASYDLIVRPPWVGALLNGRRYPRHLPTLPWETVSVVASH